MLEGQAITQLPDSVEHMKELPRMAHPEEEALLEAVWSKHSDLLLNLSNSTLVQDRESEASEDLDKLEHELGECYYTTECLIKSSNFAHRIFLWFLEQPVTAGAEPMVERDGKLIPFRQLVKADVERRPKRFYAAKVNYMWIKETE